MLIEMKKGNSSYQFSFWNDGTFNGCTLIINYKTRFDLSIEFANFEIQRLLNNGYKKNIIK